MGLLDSILANATSGGLATAAQPASQVHPGLLEAAINMLSNHSTGGLSGLMSKFQAAGVGPQFSSWVGSGPNQPVAPQQVESALGSDQISQLAQKFGLPAGQVSSHLAQLLPELVNHVTPTGQMPEHHSAVESALSMLKGKLLGG